MHRHFYHSIINTVLSADETLVDPFLYFKQKRGNAVHHLSVVRLGGVPQHQGHLQPAPGGPEVQQDQDGEASAYIVQSVADSDVLALPEIYDGCPVDTAGVYLNLVAAVGYRHTTPPELYSFPLRSSASCSFLVRSPVW